MSKISIRERKCSVCGSTNEYRVLLSTNTFGGDPDLDLRPAEMKRSTMPVWVQECPDCGFISGDVTDLTTVTREWLQSEEYLSANGIPFSSELAKRFYKYYLINLADENPEDAFYAILHAAWSCDDSDDNANAKLCRELAIPLVTELIEENRKNKDALLVTKADLLRRSGQFDTLINEYSSISFGDELLNQIIAFEIEKANEQDTKCYRVEDVTQTEES